MFSTKLSRVAHRATAAVNISTTTTVAAHRTSQCVATRSSHQRRHSSSKASCPPDSNSNGGKPAPAAKTSATAEEIPAAAAPKAPLSTSNAPQRGKRVTRAKKPRTASVDKADQPFAGLPSVQTTQGWRYDDFSVSSFFSLYRPLSLTTTIPPTCTPDQFAYIFESPQQNNPWENGNSAERRPEDVIFTLHPALQGGANSSMGAADQEPQWDVIHESHDGVKHLDGPPRKGNLDDLYRQMPFKAPPPPQPFPEEQKASKRGSKASETFEHQLRHHFANTHKTRQRSYQTVITMTESTSEDGQPVLNVERSPFVQINTTEPQPAVEAPRSQQHSSPMRFTRRFATRSCLPRRASTSERVYVQTDIMRSIRRAPTTRVKMVLISVKRQRKLKMKKHKYKKLMKRTRNLRRKQDRA